MAQEYIVAGDFDYAPFSFIDKTGKPSGFEIDVLEAIAASSGIELNFQLSTWDKALSKIKSGESDIIVGIIFSEEREEYLDFSIPIHTEYYSIFIRNDLPFQSLSSLYNYKLVALNGDVSIENYLIPMGLFDNYILAESLPNALSAIELGLADYVVAPNLLGLNVIKENKYRNIDIKGPSIIPSIFCMAVAKGNTELLHILNDGITELRRNGKLAEIQEKWNVSVTENEVFAFKSTSKIIGVIFTIAAILLLIVLVWIRLLRVQVRKATVSIKNKNEELQKSEEKFRVITENSSDIIWHLDSNFCLTYISPADERIRGFKKEEVIGKSLFSILTPEGIEKLKEANKKRMNDLSKGIRAAPAIYELEELCKDGSYVWVEATATAFYDNEGNISGYHGVSRDISERKKSELLLKERETQLKELNATKDKLFSVIAHDLRSPFNAIIGLSEILIDNHQNIDVDKSEKYLKTINSSAKNTLVLLDNLLSWAKTQTGKINFEPEKSNLHVIIYEILEVSKTNAEIKNIALRYLQTEYIEVYADTNMLKTIMRNLISNAIKFTHTNGEVTISAKQNHNNIEISVSDNGVGMSKETCSKIFGMDINFSSKGTESEKGSGLGLVLCKEFVEKHGGSIWAESELGKGSSFVFSLPLG